MYRETKAIVRLFLRLLIVKSLLLLPVDLHASIFILTDGGIFSSF